MLVNSLDAIKNKVYDVVIIGAGPAGISTALSLPLSVNVLIVEAGDVSYSEASQEHYDGRVVGDKYFDLKKCRLRQLGGTSGHWAGKSRTLDKFDFSYKAHAKYAQWPIKKEELDPYLQPAAALLKVKPSFTNKPYLWDLNVENITFDFSPVMFGFQYRRQLSESNNIDLIINTSITAAKISDSEIQALTLINTSGDKKRIKSKYYVFAMGGIENGRMLKFIAMDNPSSTLSKNENVGAYWMEHPHSTVGDFFYNIPKDDRQHIGISEQKKRELKILSCNLNFTSQLKHPADGKIKKLLRDLICVDETIGSEISYGLGRNYCGGLIDAAWEQEPSIDNRIDLDAEVDAFGIPKVVLKWQKSDLDFRTIRLTCEYIAESMAKNNFAKVRLREWLWTGKPPKNDGIGGGHHLGGTRMSRSRDDGVVDANLKCWDVSNLYMAGSSVFPSGGHANPTLTIVQLAVRLAEHLVSKP